MTTEETKEGERQHEKCSEMALQSLNRCPKVTFMVEALEKLGCSIPADFFQCRPCEPGKAMGGFTGGPTPVEGRDTPQIILCENNLIAKNSGFGQDQMDHTIAHELVHALDQCRTKARWDQCKQHACSEIRASNLSGECEWRQELNRGNTNLRGQQRVCARRRAELSVSMNPNCSGDGVAAAMVDEVFERCYQDTAPFDRNP
jgi:inner membrane protease ATP23